MFLEISKAGRNGGNVVVVWARRVNILQSTAIVADRNVCKIITFTLTTHLKRRFMKIPLRSALAHSLGAVNSIKLQLRMSPRNILQFNRRICGVKNCSSRKRILR